MKTKQINLTIDGNKVQAKPGEKVLFAALDAGIYIPNLCAIRGVRPHTGCRLCFVEIDGRPNPVTACTEEVTEGMVVRTDTEHVRRLQRTAMELLLASHPIICKSCPANGNCELQKIAPFLHIKLKQKRFRTKHRDLPVDDSHPDITLDPNLCVLCGKCIYACTEKNGASFFTYARRGFDTVISAFGIEALEADCQACQACVDICPVGALIVREDNKEKQSVSNIELPMSR